MRADLKAAWVLALRSDGYEQGKSRLKTRAIEGVQPNTQYCCLGVLADIAVRQGVLTWDTVVTNPESEHGATSPLNGHMSLPRELIAWCELEDTVATGVQAGEGTQDVLIGMNDQQDKSFAYIADWVEDHL